MSYAHSPAAHLRHDLGAIRGSWGWFVALGVILVLLGMAALGSTVMATLATAMIIGGLMIVGGVVELIGSLWSRAWSGFFCHLLSGLFSIVVGLLFWRAPLDAVLVLTMMLACLLMVVGVFKIIAALHYRFAAWGWPVASGIIDVVLGGMILAEWPASALWVIGMFVGISLIFRGFNWIGLGFAVRSLPKTA